jgi:V/A-type H+-transporting ATPase subunit E
MNKTESTESMESKIEKMEVVGEADRIRKIEDKIIAEAEEKAKAIIREAEKSKKDILEEKRKEGEREAERILRRGTEEADSLKRQKVAEARLKAKQTIMSSREDLINETMEKCKEKLAELTAYKEFGETVRKLVEQGGIGLGGGDLEIVLAGKVTKAAVDLGSVAKRVEEKTGKKTTINVAQEKSKSVGGVIVRKADGSIMIDNTFEARIGRIQRDIRTSVAKILFE